uniref:Uncharacterized protein n=1 Tax=Arundo donax TaxID=35708 RepID=A0A0A9B4F8_ARUDO
MATLIFETVSYALIISPGLASAILSTLLTEYLDAILLYEYM